MTGTTRLLLVVLTSLVVLLAACSGPQALHLDPDEGAYPLLTSRLTLSSGSVYLVGIIAGLGKTDLTIQGVVFGGFAVVCNNGTIDVPGHTETQSFRSHEISPSKNGSVKFGDSEKRNEAEFVIYDPDPATVRLCPNDKNWWGELVAVDGEYPYLLRAVVIRYTQQPHDDESWTTESWSCPLTPWAEDCVKNVSDHPVVVWSDHFVE
jgi:hypothetical protein